MKSKLKIVKDRCGELGLPWCQGPMVVRRLVFTLAFGIMSVFPIQAQTGSQAEYEIKAALLYKLVGYTEWPATAAPAPDARFRIGLLGRDSSEKALKIIQAVLSDKVAKGRKISVRQLASASEYAQCQLVFVSASEKERVPEILQAIKNSPVLVVGEVPGFAEEGGHINLLASGNTVGLEINNSAATQAGLTISSQLLKLRLVKVVKS